MDGLIVHPGRARISEDGIEVHLNTPDFLAIEVDMLSKYIQPVVTTGEDGKGPPEILLMDFGRALHLSDETTAVTTIVLPPHTTGWNVMAQGGRYTILISAWQVPK